jgi:hypothetical protein
LQPLQYLTRSFWSWNRQFGDIGGRTVWLLKGNGPHSIGETRRRYRLDNNGSFLHTNFFSILLFCPLTLLLFLSFSFSFFLSFFFFVMASFFHCPELTSYFVGYYWLWTDETICV